jgi:hypothetical protein
MGVGRTGGGLKILHDVRQGQGKRGERGRRGRGRRGGADIFGWNRSLHAIRPSPNLSNRGLYKGNLAQDSYMGEGSNEGLSRSLHEVEK